MKTRTCLFGMMIDGLTMNETVTRLVGWVHRPDSVCRFVVTPNVDHVVKFQENAALRSAYANAGLVVADGRPLVWASRLLRRPLPEAVPGSDLAPAFFDALADVGPVRLFLLGAAPGIADQAARNVERRWPWIRVCGTFSPAQGFEQDPEENRRILALIDRCHADVVIVGLGAPKQETWVCEHAHVLKASVVLCLGAAIDFLAGHKRRAPHWMRRVGLEWMHRMMTEPRRLAGRYIRDAWIFPRLLWHEYHR